MKSKGKEWFQHSDSFTANLDTAFKLWDAVSNPRPCSDGRKFLILFLLRFTKLLRMPEKIPRTLRYGMMRTTGWLRDGNINKEIVRPCQRLASVPGYCGVYSYGTSMNTVIYGDPCWTRGRTTFSWKAASAGGAASRRDTLMDLRLWRIFMHDMDLGDAYCRQWRLLLQMKRILCQYCSEVGRSHQVSSLDPLINPRLSDYPRSSPNSMNTFTLSALLKEQGIHSHIIALLIL